MFSMLRLDDGSTADNAGAPVFCTEKNLKKNIDLPPNGMEYIQHREKEYRNTVSTVLFKAVAKVTLYGNVEQQSYMIIHIIYASAENY